MTPLAVARKARGLTQREVADAIGVTTSAYADIERGRRRVTRARREAVAAVLGVDVEAVPVGCPACGR